MCSECQKQFCPSGCPDSPLPDKICSVCSAEADYRGFTGQSCCVDCISEMSLDELLRFCGFGSSLEIVMLMAGLSNKVEKLNDKYWGSFVRRRP